MDKTELCPSCRESLPAGKELKGKSPLFCPFCGYPLHPGLPSILPDTLTLKKGDSSHSPSFSYSIPLLQPPPSKKEDVQFTIGPYDILKVIGKGGMGEVFLAYDTTCGRHIALKRIRVDLKERTHLFTRFLKEAKITSQLTHPAIIPIYSIHTEGDALYYTMPYVEGQTLKQILRNVRDQEKTGKVNPNTVGSIPSLARIFTSVSQAVAYAHSKGVLHRDLKPENIIVGKYGEALILDWGLATIFESPDNEEEREDPTQSSTSAGASIQDLTQVGKVVGTVHYMAPERALGNPATVQADIYALGVILYQILTLHLPFPRNDLQDYRKNMHKEQLADPAAVAPYRDVPHELSRIVTKCLQPKPHDRYQTVDALLHDLENYLEGISDWFPVAELDPENKECWEFQENVLITEHTAITRHTEVWEWVILMISKQSFADNIKLEAKIRIKPEGLGIGFLFSVPEADERLHVNDGFCLWISADSQKETKLMRSSFELIHTPDIILKREEWYNIRIEKIDHHLHFYLNDQFQFSYISHLPVLGTHAGLMVRDASYEIKDFQVSIGGHAITVSCLAVPDAFLASKDFSRALHEYRRIGQSFSGRAEGREALFRAGITLLEEARTKQKISEADDLYNQALEEFTKLRSTPGAPLEYLGKALVYQTMELYEEEIKCFELAFRRYRKHPLLPVIEEHIIHRLHESSGQSRTAAYRFSLLTMEHLAKETLNNHTKRLFLSLQKHWESLPFILESQPPEELPYSPFVIQLAFWLAKPWVLSEILDQLYGLKHISFDIISNALFSLIELGSYKLAEQKIEQFNGGRTKIDLEPYQQKIDLLKIALNSNKDNIEAKIAQFFDAVPNPQHPDEMRILFYLIEQAIQFEILQIALRSCERIDKSTLQTPIKLQLDTIHIWTLLLLNEWDKTEAILHSYPLEELNEDSSLLHFLYGCWLYVTEGKEIAKIHFAGTLEVTFPRSWALTHHELLGKLGSDWIEEAFLWEKKQLYRQLSLYSHCLDDAEKYREYLLLAQSERLDVCD